jgi:hypothetical protein
MRMFVVRVWRQQRMHDRAVTLFLQENQGAWAKVVISMYRNECYGSRPEHLAIVFKGCPKAFADLID